jgi:putative Holliday junction resolvase
MPAALGIDYGKARIGVAATDDLRLLASPLETIQAAETDPVERIAAIAGARGVTTIVVGLPLRMDGGEGVAVADVRAFVAALRARLPEVEFVEIDERLTTKEAEAVLAAAARKGKRRRRAEPGLVDQASATLILQDYLDQQVPGEDSGHDLSFDLGLGAFDEDFD